MANQGDSSHARELFVNYLRELFAGHNYMFYREIEIIHTLKIDCSHDIPPRDEIWARIGGTVTCCKIDGSFRAFGGRRWREHSHDPTTTQGDASNPLVGPCDRRSPPIPSNRPPLRRSSILRNLWPFFDSASP